MKKYVNPLLAVSGCVFVSACAFLSPVNTGKEIADAKDEIVALGTALETKSAAYSTQPKVDLVAIPVDRSPAWMHGSIALDMQRNEFDYVQDYILKSANVSSQLGEQVDPSLAVSFRHDGSIKEALDRLAALTNYTYTVSKDVVVWSAYEGRTFFLPIAGGDYSYMIGKKSEEGSSGSSSGGSNSFSGGNSGNSVSGSSFDIDRDQFSNTRATNMNPFSDVELAVKGIVGDYGTVSASKSTSSIFVKTTPDRMVMVSEFVDRLSENLSSQVVLDLKIIQVTSESSNEHGANWKATKDLTRSVLEFEGEAATSQFTNAVPTSFRGIRNTGSGSVEVLVNALSQHSNVSVLMEHRIFTRSGKMAEISLADLRGYVAQTRAIATTDVGTSVELIQGILQGGDSIYAIAHVHGDQVSINLSSRSAMVGKVEQVGTEGSFVQLPNVKQNDFKVEQIARTGTTIVAAATRRQVSSDQANSPISAKFLPSFKGTRSVTEDIYVLVTPRIVRS